jgi:hypothetical protein
MIAIGLVILFIILTVVCFFAWVAAIPGTTAPTPELTVIRIAITAVWIAGTAGLIFVETLI